MKKLVVFVAIATLVFASCSSQSGRRNKINNLIKKIENLKIDSCQYDESGSIVYFAGGDVAVKAEKSYFIIGTDTVNNESDILKIVDIVTEKCPTPELYSSVCLRHFKQIINAQPLDSSRVIYGNVADYYDFYLKSYEISIDVSGFEEFKSKGEISTHTINIYGEYVDEFYSSANGWTYEQQEEILQLLLAKKEEKK